VCVEDTESLLCFYHRCKKVEAKMKNVKKRDQNKTVCKHWI